MYVCNCNGIKEREVRQAIAGEAGQIIIDGKVYADPAAFNDPVAAAMGRLGPASGWVLHACIRAQGCYGTRSV